MPFAAHHSLGPWDDRLQAFKVVDSIEIYTITRLEEFNGKKLVPVSKESLKLERTENKEEEHNRKDWTCVALDIQLYGLVCEVFVRILLPAIT